MESAMNTSNTMGKTAGIIVVLAIGAIVSYRGIVNNEFVNYDDAVYITKNAVVLNGLSWDGFTWAFTTTCASNWHPLTWLSHMLDVQLFGLGPAGHHFTNLFLHILATLLLFGFLFYTTGLLWPSAFVAALFALHPLHVESVAWAAERKDVLSAVLGFAAIWSYAYYARCPGIKRYVSVMILFALGLMAKPMLVTLPLVLLLFDYWPLERLAITKRCMVKLVVEKMPLLAMASASAIITLIAQQAAIGGFNRISLPIRMANAIMSYCVYIWQSFLPIKLAVTYPYVLHPNPVIVGVCALLLIIITVTIIGVGRQKKYLLTGWLWYMVTLVPVIGLVQVGSQAHADRYTYIPLIGIFVIVAWGLKAMIDRLDSGKKAVAIIASVAVLPAAGWLTGKQVGYWKNDFTLFSHAAAVTKDNCTAYNNLGYFFERAGRKDDALASYQKALELYPDYAYAHYNLGLLHSDRGRTDEAAAHFHKALECNPDYAKAHFNLGLLLAKTGRTDDALAHYRKAVEIDPDYGDAHYNLALLLTDMRLTDEAVAHYRKALDLDPNRAEAHNNLGVLLSGMGKTDEAFREFRKALEMKPNYGDAHFNLGFLLLDIGRRGEAIDHFQMALAMTPDAIGNLRDIALTFVQHGQLNDATFVLERALVLAKSAGDETQAEAIAQSLAKLHETAGTQKSMYSRQDSRK
jgi:tetratricopeptide (TPR) repeat protein